MHCIVVHCVAIANVGPIETVEVRRFDTADLTLDAGARTIGFTAGEHQLYHPMMLSASTDVLVLTQCAIPTGNRLQALHFDRYHVSE